MSKDIYVLAPNGRKVKIHCLPDTNLLQILEEVCNRNGFTSSDYELRHHNHTLDLTTMIRYSNLPNKAVLEMVPTETIREEKNVTIGLQLEDGERRTADFSPHTSLFDVIITLAPAEINTFQQPTIMYMRQEVTGLTALKENTLRHLGLIKGRAILRLMNKPEEVKQANVSTVYRKPAQENKPEPMETENASDRTAEPGPSNHPESYVSSIDPVKLLKKAKEYLVKPHKESTQNHGEPSELSSKLNNPKEKVEDNIGSNKVARNTDTQESLERRLQIEDEVTFLGAQKAVAFRQPDTIEYELEDLPDDFYELSVEEVRKLYRDLQQNRIELENTPLAPSSAREELEKQTSRLKLNKYKNAVVRIQFPDHMVLQGVFSPEDTIGDVINFIKQYLKNPDVPFKIFTTPFKDKFDHNMTLLDAKFVPCVHMHFKLLNDNQNERCLKDVVYQKQTKSDAASMLASKYRAPSRRKAEDYPSTSHSSNAASTSTSKNSKVPKWFKK